MVYPRLLAACPDFPKFLRESFITRKYEYYRHTFEFTNPEFKNIVDIIIIGRNLRVDYHPTRGVVNFRCRFVTIYVDTKNFALTNPSSSSFVIVIIIIAKTSCVREWAHAFCDTRYHNTPLSRFPPSFQYYQIVYACSFPKHSTVNIRLQNSFFFISYETT